MTLLSTKAACSAGAVATVAMVLGGPAGLAAAVDLLSAAALPLVAARAALAALLRWQLTAMAAMWRLLRGRGLPFRPWAVPGCAAGLLSSPTRGFDSCTIETVAAVP